ncbi:hypothetical protein ALC57_08811 [Trachymyrmex cornetzi]|uniref:Tc1-like transposase DDE domain-containing protein n=1 Tax=Trachymyrmex cornetzi TaxID=471704 RepID=A0A151J6N1_9HYME|nr:hypothetical protein ALC57_08811 [Trachymyrmex cornetzi]
MGKKILGSVILPERLNGASYVQFLTENLPDFLEDVSLLDRNKIIFQQDGVGSHNARIVTNFLIQQLSRRWMGRYGIYRQLPEDAEELNNKLHDAIWSIDNDVMERMQANLLRRMRACVGRWTFRAFIMKKKIERCPKIAINN